VKSLICENVDPYNSTEYIGTGRINAYKALTVTPDLSCEGSLSWMDVTSGSTVTGSFTVENIGEPSSLLDWVIIEYPTWGTWTFNPENGDDLLAGDSTNVDVEVIAPDEPETEFTGEVVLVNSDDAYDTCTILVSLTTPVNQQVDSNPLFHSLLERFPNAYQMIRYLMDI
jgi:hypothetical protein